MSSSLFHNQTAGQKACKNKGNAALSQPKSPHPSTAPERNNRRSSVGVLTTVLAVLLLCGLFCVTGCLGNPLDSDYDDSAASEHEAVEEDTVAVEEDVTADPSSAVDSSSQEGLPADFTAYDNNYSVSSYSIDVNAEGNTIVTLEGTGFDVLPMINNAIRMPINCTLLVGGQTHEWKHGSTEAESIEFEFDGKIDPDTIILTAGDDESQRVKIQVD